MKGRASLWAGLAVLVGLAVAVVWLSSGAAPAPFDPSSSSPDGYRAVSILLTDAGSTVDSVEPTDLASLTGDMTGRAVVVPVASWATPQQLGELEAMAERGATVVLAAEESFVALDDRILTRTPAQPVGRGLCSLEELESLEALDDVAFEFIDVASLTDVDTQYCFTELMGSEGSGALVTRRHVGTGSLISLASPYLWANARLQPDKEQGGEPLDNGPMAVALLGGARVTFVEAVPSEGTAPDGTRSPLALLPFNVKLALVQLTFAFVIYAWWRGRRLGRPVSEDLPVEVAGSELVEAVGGLLRRNGSVARSATVLREQECRGLAARLGVPREAGPDALVAAVASRCSRRPPEVHELLFGASPQDPEGLVALCTRLDELHSEVLDVQPAP